MPASLRRLLADPFSLGSELVEWTPPAVPPETSTLRAARTELERTTQPGSHGHIAWCLGKMAKGMAHRKGDATDWAMRTEAWADACGHFPDDLWSAATLELLQTKTYFPAPAEIVEIVGPKLNERRRMLERVKAMLGGQARLEAPKVFVAEPEAVRIRTMRDGFRRIGKVWKAAQYETRLADIEGRTVEDWAHEAPNDEPAAVAEKAPSLPPISPSLQATTMMAAARRHRQQGRAAIADRYEHDARTLAPHLFEAAGECRDIPEGAAAHG